MRIVKKLLSSIICCYLGMLPVCNADIRVGTVIFYPPFVMSTGGGFDIDLMTMLCQRLQEKCQFLPMEFSDLFTALDRGKIDLAIGGITISKMREDEFIFSLPYVLSKGQFLISSTGTIKTINQLKGIIVGVVRVEGTGGVFYDYLESDYPGFFQIKKYDNMEDIMTALDNHEISAAFVHESTALYWEQNGGGQFKTLGNPLLVGNGIAIMAIAKNQPLIQKINQQLQLLESSKAYVDLYNTYFANER